MKRPSITIFSLLPFALGAFTAPAFAQESAPVAAQQAPAAEIALPNSPFLKAKTVQMKGTFSVSDQKGNYSPFFEMSIVLDQPDRYRVEGKPLMKTDKPLPNSFYLNDGKKQYEYNSMRGRYQIADARKPGERALSQLTLMAGLDLILTPNKPPRQGVTRTITDETIDGHKMVVITDAEPGRKTKEGKELVPLTKTFIDAETGYPHHTTEGYTIDGVLTPNIKFDFTEWKLDEPIAASNFVWAVPPGAELEHDDVLAVGTVAPDFQAITPEGKTVHLSDLKGKVVILDFWATWCGPCQVSLPHLQSVYNQVKDQGVTVLALCVWDEKPKYDEWIKANKTKYTFPTAFDTGKQGGVNVASTLYKATGIPTQYVIGKDGKIAAGFVGFTQGDTRLVDALRKMKIEVKGSEKPKAEAKASR